MKTNSCKGGINFFFEGIKGGINKTRVFLLMFLLS